MMAEEIKLHLHEWQSIDEYYDSDTAVLILKLYCPLCSESIEKRVTLPKRGARRS